MQDSLSKPFRHAAVYYLRALYLGGLAAFIIASMDIIAPKGMIMPLSVILLSLAYAVIAYFLGYNTGKRGYFISFTLTIPIVIVSYWAPDSVLELSKHDQEFLLMCPIIFFLLTSIGQGVGQYARIHGKH